MKSHKSHVNATKAKKPKSHPPSKTKKPLNTKQKNILTKNGPPLLFELSCLWLNLGKLGGGFGLACVRLWGLFQLCLLLLKGRCYLYFYWFAASQPASQPASDLRIDALSHCQPL